MELFNLCVAGYLVLYVVVVLMNLMTCVDCLLWDSFICELVVW